MEKRGTQLICRTTVVGGRDVITSCPVLIHRWVYICGEQVMGLNGDLICKHVYTQWCHSVKAQRVESVPHTDKLGSQVNAFQIDRYLYALEWSSNDPCDVHFIFPCSCAVSRYNCSVLRLMGLRSALIDFPIRDANLLTGSSRNGQRRVIRGGGDQQHLNSLLSWIGNKLKLDCIVKIVVALENFSWVVFCYQGTSHHQHQWGREMD